MKEAEEIKFPLNLQLFAEEEEEEVKEEQEEETQETKESEVVNRSELDSLIGKAVSKALTNNDAKWQTKLDEEVEKAKDEAVEFAKLSEKEKESAKHKKELEAFKQEKAEFQKEKLLVAVKSDLQDVQLPTAFAESLVQLNDAEKIKTAITDIKTIWDEKIQEAIKAKVRQAAPKDSVSTKFEADANNIAEMARKNRIIK